jgi:hypothetical protein
MKKLRDGGPIIEEDTASASLPAEFVGGLVEKFHAHLDVCKQCREHPFALCPVGERLLTGQAQDRENPSPQKGQTDG